MEEPIEHRILSIDYELQDGYAARIDCSCGWWWIAANDPRYNSVEAGSDHLKAANRDYWAGLLVEAQQLPLGRGRIRDEAIERYQHQVAWSDYMIERGMLESKDDTLWRTVGRLSADD